MYTKFGTNIYRGFYQSKKPKLVTYVIPEMSLRYSFRCFCSKIFLPNTIKNWVTL